MAVGVLEEDRGRGQDDSAAAPGTLHITQPETIGLRATHYVEIYSNCERLDLGRTDGGRAR